MVKAKVNKARPLFIVLPSLIEVPTLRNEYQTISLISGSDIFLIFEAFMTQIPSHSLVLLLGSNLGDRHSFLKQAIDTLQKQLGEIQCTSSLYETKSWGLEDQPNFINQVLVCKTVNTAEESLEKCLAIEKTLGRNRKEKWGSRTIDIDILYFNDEIIATEVLKIPHPFLHERKFTLVPLVEVLPDYIHPVFNVSNTVLLERCGDLLEVSKLNSIRRGEN